MADSKRARQRYTDKFRASAVIMLEAAGYPDRPGALTQTAKHLKMPLSTLRSWFRQEHNAPPTELCNEKRFDLIEAIDAEIQAILREMPEARQDALYREMGTVFGILVDKRQLLTGHPTERSAVQYEIEWDDNLPYQGQSAPRSANGAARPIEV